MAQGTMLTQEQMNPFTAFMCTSSGFALSAYLISAAVVMLCVIITLHLVAAHCMITKQPSLHEILSGSVVLAQKAPELSTPDQ